MKGSTWCFFKVTGPSWASILLTSLTLSVQVRMAVSGWNTGWREDTTTTSTWTRRRAPGWSQRASSRTTPSSTRRTSRWVLRPCAALREAFFRRHVKHVLFFPSVGGFRGNHSLQPRAAVAGQWDANRQAAGSLPWLPGEKRPEGEDGLPDIPRPSCDPHTGERRTNWAWVCT